MVKSYAKEKNNKDNEKDEMYSSQQSLVLACRVHSLDMILMLSGAGIN